MVDIYRFFPLFVDLTVILDYNNQNIVPVRLEKLSFQQSMERTCLPFTIKVLLLIFLRCTAAGCPAHPKSPRPNRTWHPVQG